jgi:hypothetical protein
MAEKVVGRMPIWFLFFIASSGIFLILSLPIDIFSPDVLNFENGINLNNWVVIPQFFEQYFKPFIMVKYLESGVPSGSNFPVGLVEIIILGLVVGTFMYLLHDGYEWINAKIARKYIKRHLGLESPKENSMPRNSLDGWHEQNLKVGSISHLL